MTTRDSVIKVIETLNAMGIPYMVVGSFSSNTYGIPRSTHDADMVLQFEDQSISAIAKRLGPAFRVNPQMSFETVTGTMRYIVNIPKLRFTIELFLLSDDPHDRARFPRRKRIPIHGLDQQAWIASPEDVVVTKLRWSKQGQRSKDVEDVKGVIAVSGPMLDWPYIEHWCDQHGTRELLEKIRRNVAKLN